MHLKDYGHTDKSLHATKNYALQNVPLLNATTTKKQNQVNEYMLMLTSK
jgi:hypothetical protein